MRDNVATTELIPLKACCGLSGEVITPACMPNNRSPHLPPRAPEILLDAVRKHDKVSYCVMDEGFRKEGDWALGESGKQA